jgi:CheY-like chemotaxis protein
VTGGGPGGPGRQRVLVVDDVDIVRALIKRLLTAHGYHVDEAATAAEAHRLDPARYDAVLVDAHLGTERGADLIEALRVRDPAAASRCLLMSGGDTHGPPAGMPYLAKPFELSELLAAVRSLGRPAPPPAPVPGAWPQAPPRTVAPPAWRLLAITRGLRLRERSELGGFLHDGPVQELSAAVLGLQLLRRSLPPEAARGAGEILQRLAAAGHMLRSAVSGDLPLPPLTGPKAGLLSERTAWLLAAPAAVRTQEGTGRLADADIPVIADVAELLLLRLLAEGTLALAQIAVEPAGNIVRIGLAVTPVDGSEPGLGDPAVARASLADLAAAFGARAHADFAPQHWEVTLDLPW